MNESPYINKQYDNFDYMLKLFTHRSIKQKVNNNITSNPDGNGHFNNNNNIYFNKNSIVHTTQIPNNNNNETSKIDHQIDRLLAPIRQNRRLLEKNKSN